MANVSQSFMAEGQPQQKKASWLDYLSYISPATLLGRGIANSGYAKPILGTAGTIAGGVFGGPAGATIGGTAGTALGSAADSYFGPQQSPGMGNGPNGNALTGYDAYNNQLSNRNPIGQNAMDQLVHQGLGNSNFQGIENRAREQFASNTIPGLAERFTAMGNGQNSSAFQGAIGAAGAGLESQLAALRSQHGMQQLQLGLQPQYENIYTPQQGGFAQSFAQDAPKYAELLADLYSHYQKNKLGGGS